MLDSEGVYYKSHSVLRISYNKIKLFLIGKYYKTGVNVSYLNSLLSQKVELTFFERDISYVGFVFIFIDIRGPMKCTSGYLPIHEIKTWPQLWM